MVSIPQAGDGLFSLGDSKSGNSLLVAFQSLKRATASSACPGNRLNAYFDSKVSIPQAGDGLFSRPTRRYLLVQPLKFQSLKRATASSANSVRAGTSFNALCFNPSSGRRPLQP